MQVANAAHQPATFLPVADPIDPAELRRRVDRFRALLDSQFGGNKAKLGREMGWKDGAYVRQLVDCERPITEKLVAKIEAMSGGRYRGWFAAPGARPAGADPWPLDPFISREEWARLAPELRHAVAWEAAKALRQIEQASHASPEPAPRKRAGAA